MAETARIDESDDGWAMSGRRERAVMATKTPADDAPAPDRPFPTRRGVLSADEIAALLRPNLDDMDEEEAPAGPIDTLDAPTPDFTTPAPAPTDPQRSRCEETVSRLSLALRRDCGFDAAAALTQLETRAFREAIDLLAKPGWATAFLEDRAGKISGALLLSPALASAFIEAACGGKVAEQMPATPRTLTPVDAALLGTLLSPLAKAAGEGLRIARIETDARFVSALAPPAPVTVMRLSVLSNNQSTEAALLLGDMSVPTEEVVHDSGSSAAPRGVTAALTARIATLSVPVSRLSDLKPGSTLLLGLPADQPIELLSGGRNGELVAEGEIGRKGANMAIRINRRGPMLRQRT